LHTISWRDGSCFEITRQRVAVQPTRPAAGDAWCSTALVNAVGDCRIGRRQNTLHPVYPALMRHAAGGEVVYNDDTVMKILELMKQSDEDRHGRKGMYT